MGLRSVIPEPEEFGRLVKPATDELLKRAVWRRGDPLLHIGPRHNLRMPTHSPHWETECDLTGRDGIWITHVSGHDYDNVWCVPCLDQTHLRYIVSEW